MLLLEEEVRELTVVAGYYKSREAVERGHGFCRVHSALIIWKPMTAAIDALSASEDQRVSTAMLLLRVPFPGPPWTRAVVHKRWICLKPDFLGTFAVKHDLPQLAFSHVGTICRSSRRYKVLPEMLSRTGGRQGASAVENVPRWAVHTLPHPGVITHDRSTACS